jgi:hypothetical protein
MGNPENEGRLGIKGGELGWDAGTELGSGLGIGKFVGRKLNWGSRLLISEGRSDLGSWGTATGAEYAGKDTARSTKAKNGMDVRISDWSGWVVQHRRRDVTERI